MAAWALFLALDQCGRTSFHAVVRPMTLGARASVALALPTAARYDLFVRGRLQGALDSLSLSAPALRLERRHVRGINLWPITDIYLGRATLTAGELRATLVSGRGSGSISEVVAEVAPPLLTHDQWQRLAACVAVVLLLLGTHGWRRAAPVRVAALSLICMTRALVLGAFPFGLGDLRTAFLPWYRFSWQEVGQGWLPLWNPFVFWGTPHLANPETQILYPPVFLALLCGLPYHWYEAVSWTLHPAIAGTGAYLLGRRFGQTAEGATACAVAFMFTPLFIDSEQQAVIAGTSFVPWLLLAAMGSGPPLHRALAVAAAVLAGHPQVLAYTALAMVVVMLAKPERGGPAAHVALVILAGIVATAATSLPFVEYARLCSRRAGLTLDHAAAGAVGVENVRKVLSTGLEARRITRLGSAGWSTVFMTGAVGGLLAILAAASWRRRALRAPLVLLMLGLALSLGNLGQWSPFVLLWRLPLFTSSRVPARALLLTAVGTCLLAGTGLDRAATFVARRRFTPAATLLLCLLAAERVDDFVAIKAGAFPSSFRIAPSGRRPRNGGARLALGSPTPNDAMVTRVRTPWGYDPLVPGRTVMLWNAIQPGMFRFDDQGRLATLFPALDAAVVLAPEQAAALGWLGISQLQGPQRVLEGLRGTPGIQLGRRGACDLPEGARAMLWPEVRRVASLAEAERSLRGIPSMVSVLGAGTTLEAPRHLALALPAALPLAPPVTMVMMTSGCPEGGIVARVTIAGDSGRSDVALACDARAASREALRTVMPRETRSVAVPGILRDETLLITTFTWTPEALGDPHRIEVRPAAPRLRVEDVQWRARAPRPLQARPPIVEAAPAAAAPGARAGGRPTPLATASPSTTRILLGLHGTPGTVVVADAFYPGWRARVDGAEVSIAPVDLALMGVAVPQGGKLLELRFVPFSFRLGLFVSCVVLAGAASVRWRAPAHGCPSLPSRARS